jgi:hypothetical protein
MNVLGLSVLPIYLLLGFCATAFTSVHQPIQLVGRTADYTDARLALGAAALLHWLALLSVAFGISWLQPTPLRAHIACLVLYTAAQVLMVKSYQLLGTENGLTLRAPVNVGKLKLMIALCGFILLAPGAGLLFSMFA